MPLNLWWMMKLFLDSIHDFGGFGYMMSTDDACPLNDGVIIP